MPAELRPLKELFLAALAVAPEERAAWLERECAQDPELRRRVELLLAAHDTPQSLLDRPACPPEPGTSLQGVADTERIAPEGPDGPSTILAGRYKLLEAIGEGGMGAVWMAEQTQPVKRLVAVKLIKPGMDSRQVLARFEAERQALALMDHPNIAKVHDAGATADGRPFFVMELVQGVPITRFCDERRLTPRERLELFVPVCQAVQHAHQKGVIHRDLKPSNVLAGLYDGRPVPKVIDFGVAKATAQRLAERTMHTELGQVVGTLEYMSPEQAQPDNLDIDTRSDIYSLGVLLYELLTGTTPLPRMRLKEPALLEALRLIREEEPPRPSTRLSTIEELPGIAASRGLEPKKLSGQVKGELDWIVMKCLEKDRARRYDTANGLARDIERYLHDEPVEACPPSVGYRVRKFVRRNKASVGAAAAVLLTLVAGTLGTTVGLVRAEQARWEEAERAAGERRAQQEARVREAETQAVLDFVEKRVFVAARPETQDGGLGHDVTLRRAIEAALPFVDVSFVDRPLIEARLRITLGISFDHLGDAKRANEQFEKARMLYTEHRGPDHPDTLDSMRNLAESYDVLGRHADARKLRDEMLALRAAKLGPDQGDAIESMSHLADSYDALGRHVEALSLRQETLALQKEKLGLDDLHTLDSMNKLANSYSQLGRYAEALPLREEGLARMKARLGSVHPFTLRRMYTLAMTYAAIGREVEAVKLWKEALALMQANLGPEHPDTLASQRAMRDVQTLLKLREAVRQKPEDAEAREAVRLRPDLAVAHYTLGEILYRRDQVPGAEAAFREATRLKPDWALLRFQIGDTYARSGRWDQAVASYSRGLELDPSNHWQWYRAAVLWLQVGDFPSYRRACGEMLERFGGADPPEIAERTAKTCGLAPCAVGNFCRVEELAERAVLESGNEWFYRHAVLARGLTEYRAGRPAGAVEWLKRYAPREEDKSYGMFAFAVLAMAHHHLGQADEARTAFAAAGAIRAAQMPVPAKGRPFGNDWHDWLMAEALYREAEALLPKGRGDGGPRPKE